ncbi:rhodanese-like domain-containing protein [Chitinophaga alhagiae]|uniref:rhodanese-like domain-containing protein n=1 Tax=Chitinophaga alhagiae TaxID=2203219 RepID=UPI000E5C2161|nr:rhodanese-like domain-containing protein [Chitinophaga alhagiae]
MNRILFTVALLLVAAGGWAQDAVTPEVFEKGMRQPGVQLLDVRTAREFNTGHLQNALQADFTKKDEFFERVKYIDKSKPVYVYCLSGGRSTAAAKWMRENGYEQVVEMTGGVMAWKNAGKKLTGAAAPGPQMAIADFQKAVKAGKWVLVDVGAAWCPPCRKMEPVVKQFRTAQKVEVLHVDGGKDTDVMKRIQATTLPTFVLYKDGKEVWRKEGVATLEEMKAAMQ